jgi:hypothetical protein
MNKFNYVYPQRKELAMCISDILMDLNTPSITIKKIAKLVLKASKRLDRQDVIEVLEVHNLIKR